MKAESVGDVNCSPNTAAGLSAARFASVLGYGRVDYESDLLELPKSVPRELCPLVAEISLVDSRSSHMFGPGTSARLEVKDLLRNSLTSDVTCNNRRFLDRAKQTFRDRLLSRNRTRYVCGVLGGIAVVSTLALQVRHLDPGSLDRLGMSSSLCCTWTILFAGMGTLCSVFTRLAAIDLCEETGSVFVFLSGLFRPVTAILFTLAIIQLLELDLLSLNIGSPAKPGASHEHLYLFAAFLSGFSERFASDLIGRAERVINAPP